MIALNQPDVQPNDGQAAAAAAAAAVEFSALPFHSRPTQAMPA
jgi:hypothetical protein